MTPVLDRPPMFSLAPLRFPPARSISDIRLGFKYVESPFPTVTDDAAVVVIGDGSDSTADV